MINMSLKIKQSQKPPNRLKKRKYYETQGNMLPPTLELYEKPTGNRCYDENQNHFVPWNQTEVKKQIIEKEE